MKKAFFSVLFAFLASSTALAQLKANTGNELKGSIPGQLDLLARHDQLMMVIGASVALLAAAGIAVFIYHSRMKQQLTQLKVRSRFAADLHQEITASITRINLLSQVMSRQTDPVMQQALIEKVTRSSREVMDKMDDADWMIKQGEADESLISRLERSALEIAARTDLPIQLELVALETVKLTVKQRMNIYLVFREALNNAAQYSGARGVRVHAERKGSQLLLAVIDNGTKFQAHNNGHGAISERARELGGQLTVTSDLNKGTTVLLKLNV